MSSKLKFTSKTYGKSKTAKRTPAPKADAPVTHAPAPIPTNTGKGGVYRSLGGGKRVRI